MQCTRVDVFDAKQQQQQQIPAKNVLITCGCVVVDVLCAMCACVCVAIIDDVWMTSD